MAAARVLVVEDEGLIAHDIADRLEGAGYEVAGITESGEETLQKVAEVNPDLVLMDIRLKGQLDGIETAARVQERFDLPIIYLTAHNDRETLDRAKLTGPFGYLTKPLQQSNLRTSIEIALYKHHLEREIQRQRAWLSTVLRIMAEAVIVTDSMGSIQFLNPAAERLTGWGLEEARQKKLLEVMEIFDHNLERLGEEALAAMMLADSTTPLPRGLTALDRSGRAFVLEGEIAPSLDGKENCGSVFTFRDVTKRRKEEQLVRHENKMEAVGRLASDLAYDFNNVLAEIRGHVEEAQRQDLVNPDARAWLEKVLQSTEAGKTLTEQLLMFGYVWAA